MINLHKRMLPTAGGGGGGGGGARSNPQPPDHQSNKATPTAASL